MMQILLVDDDPTILLLHGYLLKQAQLGTEHTEFYHGQAVLDYLDSQTDATTRYLILLDINMPVLNGWDFLDALQTRAFKARVQVAIVTSSINPEDRLKANQYPQVKAYLVKPIRPDDFETLRSLNSTETP